MSAMFNIFAKEFVQIMSLRDLNTYFSCLDPHFCPVLNKMNKEREIGEKKTNSTNTLRNAI